MMINIVVQGDYWQVIFENGSYSVIYLFQYIAKSGHATHKPKLVWGNNRIFNLNRS